MNIFINYESLMSTINALTKDNQDINDTMSQIYENIKKITDDNVWRSPEKSVVLDELIPYLEKTNNSVSTGVNNCVSVLNNALRKYMKENNILEKNVSNISDIEII